MVTPLVRRPRTGPPYKLPPRSEYDGRPNESIADAHWKQHPFFFGKFAAGNLGWQYGRHIKAWRRAFAWHLEGFLLESRNLETPAPLSEFLRPLKLFAIDIRQRPDFSVVESWELPFGLLLLVTVSAVKMTTHTSGAREYARGFLYDSGKRRQFLIYEPPQ